jgi:hypothetical protein
VLFFTVYMCIYSILISSISVREGKRYEYEYVCCTMSCLIPQQIDLMQDEEGPSAKICGLSCRFLIPLNGTPRPWLVGWWGGGFIPKRLYINRVHQCTRDEMLHPFLFIRGLSSPSSVQTLLTQNCLYLDFLTTVFLYLVVTLAF